MFNCVNYMRNIAVNLKSISHSEEKQSFYRMSGIASMEEVLSNLTTGSFPAVVVEDSLEGSITDQVSDNILDRQYYIFYVFDRVEFLNHDQREATKRSLRGMVQLIISRMLRDHLSDLSRVTSFGLSNLEPASTSYRAIGPFADNLIGLAVSFTVLSNPHFSFDASKWLDLS